MGRWSSLEESYIVKLKEILHEELSTCPQFPEVVGDRRIVRFIRGNDNNIEKATTMMAEFLAWRKEKEVDKIRQDIVYGGLNEPSKFPNGQLILELVPQIIMSANATDYGGNPICVEHYSFSPREVFERVTLDQYLTFLTYCMEYRMLILEQLSDKKERAYISSQIQEGKELSDLNEYGVILRMTVIRDMDGLGFDHIGEQGRSIVSAALKLAYCNYTETLHKSYFIKSPFIINLIWYFVRGFLDASTLSKITFNGGNYYSALAKDIAPENIPVRFGGLFEGGDEPFIFDVTEGGPLHYPGAPTPDNFVNNLVTTTTAPKLDVQQEVVTEKSLPVNATCCDSDTSKNKKEANTLESDLKI